MVPPPVIVDCPAPCPRVTVLPLIGWLAASRSVTVTVEVEVPSAVTEVGLATTVEVPALTAPAVKDTVAVWVMTKLSVESVAVYVTASTVESFTVNVTCPLALVLPPPVIVELPPLGARVTVLPLIGKLEEFKSVTVIVDVAVPFARTEVGLATTVDVPTSTVPTTEVVGAGPVSVRAVPPPPEFWSSRIVQGSAVPVVTPVAFKTRVMVPASPAASTEPPVCEVNETIWPVPGYVASHVPQLVAVVVS